MEPTIHAAIVEALPCPIVITTPHGLIEGASEAVATALQVPTEFLRGKPLIGFVARSDCNAFRALLRGAADGAQTACLRLRARRGGGVFSANVQVLRTGKGIVLWILRLGETAVDEPSRERVHGATAITSRASPAAE